MPRHINCTIAPLGRVFPGGLITVGQVAVAARVMRAGLHGMSACPAAVDRLSADNREVYGAMNNNF